MRVFQAGLLLAFAGCTPLRLVGRVYLDKSEYPPELREQVKACSKTSLPQDCEPLLYHPGKGWPSLHMAMFYWLLERNVIHRLDRADYDYLKKYPLFTPDFFTQYFGPECTWGADASQVSCSELHGLFAAKEEALAFVQMHCPLLQESRACAFYEATYPEEYAEAASQAEP